jgi:8-oxo-dGTP pyrophosphatase MutT (NUDIX family)
MDRTLFSTVQFAIIIVRNPVDGRFLAVNETKNRGWWVPGGAVDARETFYQAAHRETWEEAQVKIDVKGVLRVEHSLTGADSCRMRVILYAEPKDERQVPKSIPDAESLEARWVTVEEFKQLDKIRGDELIVWGNYLNNGG